MTGIIAISRNTSSIIAVFCRTRAVAPLPKAQRRSILKRIEEIAENLGRDLPKIYWHVIGSIQRIKTAMVVSDNLWKAVDAIGGVRQDMRGAQMKGLHRRLLGGMAESSSGVKGGLERLVKWTGSKPLKAKVKKLCRALLTWVEPEYGAGLDGENWKVIGKSLILAYMDLAKA